MQPPSCALQSLEAKLSIIQCTSEFVQYGWVVTEFYPRIGISCFFFPPHSFQSWQEDEGG